MKIVMILMDRESGMFQYAALLSNALSKTEQVTVIAPAGSEERFFEDTVKLVLLKVGDRKRNFVPNTVNPWRAAKFLKTIQLEQPDIIHFHNSYVIWPCLFFPWLRKYKKVIMLPDGAMLPGQRRMDKVIARTLHIKATDGIIVLSKHDMELVNKECPDKKCYAIPHGTNSLYLEYETASAQKNSDVLFFGGVQKYKGLEYFLNAVPLILQKRPGTKITVAAHGDTERYPQLASLNSRITLYDDFIPHQQVAELFAGTRIVVLPYTSQVYSGVISVAYAFGKPVVATTMLSEQVDDGKTGLIVPPRDASALADAILKLLGNEQLMVEMGQNAIYKSNHDLSWDTIARQTLECYRNICD